VDGVAIGQAAATSQQEANQEFGAMVGHGAAQEGGQSHAPLSNGQGSLG
jgi:hypothetical protein